MSSVPPVSWETWSQTLCMLFALVTSSSKHSMPMLCKSVIVPGFLAVAKTRKPKRFERVFLDQRFVHFHLVYDILLMR